MVILTTLMEFAGVLGIVLLNAFFVVAEIAIVKVRMTQIEPLVRRGHRVAHLTQHILTHLDTYLSATQLGITFTSLALGWLGEPFFARVLHDSLEGVGITVQPWLSSLTVIAGFVLMSYILIVLGELTPRWYGIQHAPRVALVVSRPLYAFQTVFRPFIWILNKSASGLMRMAGLSPVFDGESMHSEEEMRLLLSRGRAIPAVERMISLNAFDLRTRTVREIMIPRTSVVFLSTRRTIEENVATAMASQFTRFPLCEKDLDNVLGMIHFKDLFGMRLEKGAGTRLLEIKREMLFVPETIALDRILNTFLTKRQLMAMAVDEYGGTAGLVTLENVLEELVGDINDEFDTEQADVRKVSDDEYVVEGGMALHDFARRFEIVPASKEVVTVSGYVIHLMGRIPVAGATITLGRWVATVDVVEGRKVRKLRLKKVLASDTLPVP